MGSSALNSSGVHWCRRRVRFSEVPEKVPKVPEKVSEKVWEALVQSQVRFNRVPEKVPEKVSEKVCKALVQSQVRFNRQQGSGEGSGEGLDKVPEKVLGIFGAGPGQVQRVPEIRRFRRRLQIRFRRNLFFFFLFSCVCTLRTCKNKTLRLLGIPPKLIFLVSQLALKFPQDE